MAFSPPAIVSWPANRAASPVSSCETLAGLYFPSALIPSIATVFRQCILNLSLRQSFQKNWDLTRISRQTANV
jgi:hypothetical protein